MIKCVQLIFSAITAFRPSCTSIKALQKLMNSLVQLQLRDPLRFFKKNVNKVFHMGLSRTLTGSS